MTLVYIKHEIKYDNKNHFQILISFKTLQSFEKDYIEASCMHCTTLYHYCVLSHSVF